MTAQDMIDDVAKQLSGLKISDTTVPANVTTLLSFLNLAKNQLALDTLTWLGGENITMTSDNEYTLTKTPIQIIDMYDDKLNLRPRNSPDTKGYFQLSPSVIYINSPEVDVVLNVNYYYTPDDYILTDVIDFPPSLVNAARLYMSHLGFDIYKSEKEQMLSDKYLSKYELAKNKYMMKTDNGNVDTVLEIDLIQQKGMV